MINIINFTSVSKLPKLIIVRGIIKHNMTTQKQLIADDNQQWMEHMTKKHFGATVAAACLRGKIARKRVAELLLCPICLSNENTLTTCDNGHSFCEKCMLKRLSAVYEEGNFSFGADGNVNYSKCFICRCSMYDRNFSEKYLQLIPCIIINGLSKIANYSTADRNRKYREMILYNNFIRGMPSRYCEKVQYNNFIRGFIRGMPSPN